MVNIKTYLKDYQEQIDEIVSIDNDAESFTIKFGDK